MEKEINAGLMDFSLCVISYNSCIIRRERVAVACIYGKVNNEVIEVQHSVVFDSFFFHQSQIVVDIVITI